MRLLSCYRGRRGRHHGHGRCIRPAPRFVARSQPALNQNTSAKPGAYVSAEPQVLHVGTADAPSHPCRPHRTKYCRTIHGLRDCTRVCVSEYEVRYQDSSDCGAFSRQFNPSLATAGCGSHFLAGCVCADAAPVRCSSSDLTSAGCAHLHKFRAFHTTRPFAKPAELNKSKPHLKPAATHGPALVSQFRRPSVLRHCRGRCLPVRQVPRRVLTNTRRTASTPALEPAPNADAEELRRTRSALASSPLWEEIREVYGPLSTPRPSAETKTTIVFPA